MRSINLSSCCTVVFLALILTLPSKGQSITPLKPDVPAKFTLEGRKSHEFRMDLKADEVCNITSDASEDVPLQMSIVLPTGEELVKDLEPSDGYVFVTGVAGTYRIVFGVPKGVPDEDVAKQNDKQVSIRYTNKFLLPTSAKTVAVRNVNGYQAKIANETGDEGKTFFVVQKNGKLKSVMRAAKVITGGYYFSDDPKQLDGTNPKTSARLMRTTPDKTGDGAPDVAVEYYSGGAHCCFEITFFELGSRVRQLATINTENDRMAAVAKKPGGGLRFEFAEQGFAYWNINFAQSPMPAIIWEFDKSDQLVPRFDLMKKNAPSPTKLRRDATLMKTKINLNPYTSPEDNFNDWEEPFWAEMLDLIYTGHEDLAWQYFDLVWPAKKKGKEKFRSDFIEQLSTSAYGEAKKNNSR